jgi:cold shock CspA family protein
MPMGAERKVSRQTWPRTRNCIGASAQGMEIVMLSAIVKYDKTKGFGFLVNVVDDSRRQLFFHIHDWHGNVAPVVGMAVEFDLGPSRKPGMADVAINIRVAQIDAATQSDADGAK